MGSEGHFIDLALKGPLLALPRSRKAPHRLQKLKPAGRLAHVPLDAGKRRELQEPECGGCPSRSQPRSPPTGGLGTFRGTMAMG